MDPLARASKLRQEADYVMQSVGLHGILAPYGPVACIGSYFLDVMAYPDIDLCIPGCRYLDNARFAVYQARRRLKPSDYEVQVPSRGLSYPQQVPSGAFTS